MQVINSPECLTNTISLGKRKKRFFLAGSIEQGVAEDWQTKVIKSLEDFSGIIYNPRRKEWDSSWVQSIDNPQFKEQVEWELTALMKADYVLMYFDPKTYSPITLLELGLYANSGKLWVVCPDGFWRKGNVEVMADYYEFPLINTLEDMIESVKYIVK